MQISNDYVVVEKHEVPVKEGDIPVAEVQDNFVYKGKVKIVPEAPIFLGNTKLAVGNVILFAKYSPDTQEIEVDGQKVKFVKRTDVMALED